MQNKLIGIIPATEENAVRALLQVLGTVFPARFEGRGPGQFESLDAVLFLGGGPSAPPPGLPSLRVGLEAAPANGAAAAPVQFGAGDGTPPVFRGRSVGQDSLGINPRLLPADGSEIIATVAGLPVWETRQHGGWRHDSTCFSLPHLYETDALIDRVQSGNFIRLLPLLEFLRRVTGEDQWSSPGLRAAFMFDDPNLRATRYGALDYPQLAAEAARHNYHATFATIPLDAFLASKKSAAFFNGPQARLSLLIHGNDHLRNELASFSSYEESVASLAQALRRISRMEEKVSVAVARVMAAPHGACSEETLGVMARLGFEAACISHGSLRFHNPSRGWTKNIGLRMAEIIAGLPVFPRLKMSRESENAMLMAAYLHQPIIPLGHHFDVAPGLDLLADMAGFINSLGSVRWLNMTEMARSNYQTRSQNSRLHVRSYARIIQIPIPAGITEISVERPWPDTRSGETLRLTKTGAAPQSFPGYAGEPVSARAGDLVEIALLPQDPVDPNSVPLSGSRLWPLARRQLCEWRDRLMPVAKN